jgi:hypothetical protein
MRKPLLDQTPLQNLAGPMEIKVQPRRHFSKNEQFDPLNLAAKEDGFAMFHKGCGGKIEVRLKEQVRRLLLLPLSSKRSYRFVCTSCRDEYEVEGSGQESMGDRYAFVQECLRRALTEKQGSYGSPRHLSFSFEEPKREEGAPVGVGPASED